MPGYRGHVRAGIVWYTAFLAAAFGLWFFQSVLPVSGWERFLPFGARWAATAAGVAACFGVAVLSALFPDIDIKSKGQVLFYRMFLLADLALILLYYQRRELRYLEGAAFFGLAAMLPLIGKHRGWTHSFASLIALPGALLFLPMAIRNGVTWVGLPYAAAALVGYASHLYQDGLLFRRSRNRA